MRYLGTLRAVVSWVAFDAWRFQRFGFRAVRTAGGGVGPTGGGGAGGDGVTQDVKPRMEPKDRWIALFNEMEATALDDSKLGASLLALDQNYRKQLKALDKMSDPKLLENLLLGILATRDHPLNNLVEHFTALFSELYSRQSNMLETTKIAAATLDRAVENVRTFIEKTVTLILQRYPEIDTHNKRETCRQTIQEAVFPRIYTDLFAIYQRKHFYRDAEFTQKLYALQVIRSHDLGVSDYLSLEDIIANASLSKTLSPLASPSGTVTRGTAPAALGAAVNGHATDSAATSSTASAAAPPLAVGSLLTSSLAGAANGVASPRDAAGSTGEGSPGQNKLRPKKDWRGDAVRKLTNNKAPPSSKTMSLPRSVNSYVPSLPSNGLFSATRTGGGTAGIGNGSGSGTSSGIAGSLASRTVVAVSGGGSGATHNAAEVLSRSPRAAVIEHGLMSFSPGKPRSARQYPESSSLHIQNMKLQKERETTEKQMFEKQQVAAKAVSVVLKDGDSSGAVKKQVGFMTNPLGWGALASLNKANGTGNTDGNGAPATVPEDSPDLTAGSSSTLLSASVPVFSLEHIPATMGHGSGSSRAPSGSTSSVVGALTPTGSPHMPIAPNPTPIDSLMAQRFGPGTFSPSSHAFSGAQPPANTDSPTASASASAAAGSSHNTGLSHSGASAPVNIKRLDALPPPQFGAATAQPSSSSAAAATSSSAAAVSGSSPHTTIAMNAGPSSGTAAAAVSAAVAAATSGTGAAPPSTSAAAAAPKPASGLTAALTQMGIASRPPTVDPEASHPYRLAIDSLKKLSLQKTPREKLQCIVVMSEDICTCVDECYKRLSIARAEGSEKLCINADDLLSLFALLLIKSKLSHVISEANFIEDFVGEPLKLAMPGYFLATLQAAIELIGKIDRKSVAGAGGASTASADGKTSSSRSASTSAAAAGSKSGGGTGTGTHGRRGSDASWETTSVSSQISQTSQLSQILADFT